MKEPKQRRSKDLVDSIIEAAAHILSEPAGDPFTTNHIAARAGVSIGSLYQYFEDKDEIVSEVGTRFERELVMTMASSAKAASGTTIRQSATFFVEAHLCALSVRPHLYVALSKHLADRHDREWISGYRAMMINAIATHLEERPRTAILSDSQLIAFVLFHAVDGVAKAAMTSGEFSLENRALTEQIATLVTSYLVELTGHPADE